MPKAIDNIADFPTICQHQPPTDVEVRSFCYLGDGRVAVTLETTGGEPVTFIMTGDVFLRAVRLMDAFFDAHVWDIVNALKMT